LNDNSKIEGALEIFQYLNKVGAENGVGHLDMVENRYVGIKSRGIYETPGGTIFHISHRDLEGVCLDREVLKLKQAMLPEFARVIYYGY
jgi:argininosuccinate synthase